VIALAATLLTASVAASPAWGQDAGSQPPDPSGAGSAPPPPPPVPPAPTAPASSPGTAPAVPTPPPVPDVPPVEQRSGAAASGDPGLKPPHGGSYVYSTDGSTTTIELPAKRAGRKSSQVSTGYPDRGSVPRQNRYTVDKPGRRDGRGSAVRRRANAKISSRGGVPGFGNQLPTRNPSVSLLRSTGGAAGLALAGVLAVLGAAVVLRRDRSTIFRVPTATWRPLAYVPPIDLPG
jgi:hypothetical protein